MKSALRLTLITVTLLLTWAAMIWAQWNWEFAMGINLLVMPLLMLAMGFVAAKLAPGRFDDMFK